MLVYMTKRLLLALPVLIILVGLVAPASIRERALSTFDPNFACNQDRIAMLKAGVDATQASKFRITANYILPGAVYSGLTKTNFDNPEIAAIWAKKAALRRLGQPMEVAHAVLFLASDEASYITGHTLAVTGGR